MDLALNPTNSADNAPDLAKYADAAQPYAGLSQGSAAARPAQQAKPSAARPEGAKGKGKEKAAAVVRVPRGNDVDSITRSIMAMVGPAALCGSCATSRVVIIRGLLLTEGAGKMSQDM